jgi:ATP-dependent DNA helicase RecQ
MAQNTSIEEALERFGLREFRPGQREIIEAVISGRPSIAVLPTGAGKSLCYQLPAVALGGLTVVVSPLISLMKDQVDALLQRGIPATFINSSVEPGERDARLQAAVAGEVRLLYVAPERFRVPAFVAALERLRLTLLAVDEAHCISEWGHDFRPDYARLGEVVARLEPRRLVALTATATPDVRQEIGAQLGMREPQVFVRGFDRPNLELAVRPSGGDGDKLDACLQLLDQPAQRGRPALIYTATRKKSEKVAEALRERGLLAAAYHAGLSDEERASVQERWMADRARVIVATNAFGMGVDKRDVRLVIHHDLPGSAEAYYQEAGRAGRDGLPARCVLLFNHGDVRLREFLIANANDGAPRSPEREEAERERLRAMTSYAYVRTCRRRFLLGYFGDPAQPGPGDRCGACDVCVALGGADASDAAELGDEEHLLVRKLLATVARLDGKFGRTRIALVLEGSTAKEVAGLERLSTFGVLRGRSHAFVLDLLGAVEAGGLLESSGGDYPTLRITRDGREVMHDRRRARIAFPAERREKRSRAPKLDDAAAGDEAPVDRALFDRLRALRLELASAERLPAYCVFHDRTLMELARARPQSLDELGRVSGVGPMKLAKYGRAFLAALADGGAALVGEPVVEVDAMAEREAER